MQPFHGAITASLCLYDLLGASGHVAYSHLVEASPKQPKTYGGVYRCCCRFVDQVGIRGANLSLGV